MIEKHKKIKNRLFYKLLVTLTSPVSVSNGMSSETDHDIITTEDNRPFITGFSSAGAILNYLENIGIKSNLLLAFFGDTESQKNRMSRIFISDIVLDNVKISVRDGIRIGESKITVENTKYDYQIVETGAEGKLFIEYVIYDDDLITADDAENLTLHIISGINNGEIRFGMKKQRGMGIINVSEKYGYKRFDYESINPDEYLDFLENKNYDEKEIGKLFDKNNKNLTISLNLVQNGGISIRTYSAIPNAPDFLHIKTNGHAVIPGSSWNGAIRSRVFDILQNSLEADEKTVNELKAVWGEVGENKFVLSQIEINESIIYEDENSESGFINIARNKINRFDNSTVDRALYFESSFFGGNTKLNITIKNISENSWVAGLIILALKDIVNGLLAIGGQTSIGRGIFSGNLDIDDPIYKVHLSALHNKLKGVN